GICLDDLGELARQGAPVVEAPVRAKGSADNMAAASTPTPTPTPTPGATAAPGQQQLSSEVLRQLASNHSASFAEVLRRGGCSLAISTYQAGKLVLARMENDAVNTAFKSLPKPMGIAVDAGRMAI